MSRVLRTLALAFVLSLTPACASLHLADPVASGQTADQKAYALISAYALVLEEAAALAADPATPQALKDALVKAEAVATPAVALVKTAAVAAHQAGGEANAATRMQALAAALAAAAGPVAALSQLLQR